MGHEYRRTPVGTNIHTYIHIHTYTYTHTIDALMKQEQELFHGVPHLGLGQVQQRHHLEVELPEEVGEVVDVHHGGFELRVVHVGQVADQKSHFVRRWEVGKRDNGGLGGMIHHHMDRAGVTS